MQGKQQRNYEETFRATERMLNWLKSMIDWWSDATKSAWRAVRGTVSSEVRRMKCVRRSAGLNLYNAIRSVVGSDHNHFWMSYFVRQEFMQYFLLAMWGWITVICVAQLTALQSKFDWSYSYALWCGEIGDTKWWPSWSVNIIIRTRSFHIK